MEINGTNIDNSEGVPFTGDQENTVFSEINEKITDKSVAQKLVNLIQVMEANAKTDDKLNSITQIIKTVNTDTATEVVENNKIFHNLKNHHKIILSEILSKEKKLSEKAFNKIIEEADEDLISDIVKNKKVYKSLNRSNKQKIIEKLFLSPWLSKEDAEGMLRLLELSEKVEVLPEEKKKLGLFKEKGQLDIASRLLNVGINMDTIFRIFKIKNLPGKSIPDFFKEF